MEIQVSSNFERALFDAYDRDGNAVTQLMGELKSGGFHVSQGAMQVLRELYDSGRVSEEETLAMIAQANAHMGELLCPHSAIGVQVADDLVAKNLDAVVGLIHPDVRTASDRVTPDPVGLEQPTLGKEIRGFVSWNMNDAFNYRCS